jgi:hypothetical protein
MVKFTHAFRLSVPERQNYSAPACLAAFEYPQARFQNGLGAPLFLVVPSAAFLPEDVSTWCSAEFP